MKEEGAYCILKRLGKTCVYIVLVFSEQKGENLDRGNLHFSCFEYYWIVTAAPIRLFQTFVPH